MADTRPKFVYDAGAGNVTITFASTLFDADDFSSKGASAKAFGGSGMRQVTHNYVEEVATLDFQFVTQALKDLVETMMNAWVIKGNSFKYYPDQNAGTFHTVELQDLAGGWKPTLQFKVGTPKYWKFKLAVRKVIS